MAAHNKTKVPAIYSYHAIHPQQQSHQSWNKARLQPLEKTQSDVNRPPPYINQIFQQNVTMEKGPADAQPTQKSCSHTQSAKGDTPTIASKPTQTGQLAYQQKPAEFKTNESPVNKSYVQETPSKQTAKVETKPHMDGSLKLSPSNQNTLRSSLKNPRTNFIVGVIVTMFFNLPLGLLAIYMSSQSGKAFDNRQIKRGDRCATYSLVTSMTGIVVTLTVLILLVWYSDEWYYHD